MPSRRRTTTKSTSEANASFSCKQVELVWVQFCFDCSIVFFCFNFYWFCQLCMAFQVDLFVKCVKRIKMKSLQEFFVSSIWWPWQSQRVQSTISVCIWRSILKPITAWPVQKHFCPNSKDRYIYDSFLLTIQFCTQFHSIQLKMICISFSSTMTIT